MFPAAPPKIELPDRIISLQHYQVSQGIDPRNARAAKQAEILPLSQYKNSLM
jgi:hypothetical protein